MLQDVPVLRERLNVAEQTEPESGAVLPGERAARHNAPTAPPGHGDRHDLPWLHREPLAGQRGRRRGPGVTLGAGLGIREFDHKRMYLEMDIYTVVLKM